MLETEEREPLWIRWVSSEITPESCVWRGSASDNGGRTWLLLQEMRMRRRAAG